MEKAEAEAETFSIDNNVELRTCQIFFVILILEKQTLKKHDLFVMFIDKS